MDDKLSAPVEQKGSLVGGIVAHLGPALLLCTLVEITHFSLVGLVGSFFIISFPNLLLILWLEKNDPCVELTPFSLSDMLKGIVLIFPTAVGIGGMFITLGWWFLQPIFPCHLLYSTWFMVIIALLLTDLCYYGIHRFLNHSVSKNRLLHWYKKNHAAHHTVKALDFFRGNHSSLFDTAITGFQFPLIVISTVLGMDLATTLTTYALILLLQSTHHANHTFNIGVLRYIFVDNHSHKLHHCLRGYEINFAAIFSIWDLLFHTYYENWDLSASYLAKNRIPLSIK